MSRFALLGRYALVLLIAAAGAVAVTAQDNAAPGMRVYLHKDWRIQSSCVAKAMGEQISAVVKAVHPKPVNLLNGFLELSLGDAEALGVRRISVGGSLARSAWAGFMRSAREMAEKGTFAELAHGHPGGELNKMFS